MTIKKKFAAAGAAALTIVGVAFGASPAMADPVPNTDKRQLAGAGSDTTQHVMNALGNAITNANGKVIASWDAVGSPTIETKTGGPSFTRPNGSTNGLRALSASINNTVWGGTNALGGQVDFARSSSSPSASGSDLTFIPFARDAVSYAYADVAGAVPSNLTTAQLKDIYLRNVTTYTVGGTTYNYVPVLPQAGSGTRSFFLSKLGLTEFQVSTIPSAIGGVDVQENDGTLITAPGQLVPFSVASWIAQDNGVTTNTLGTSVLGSVNGVPAINASDELNTAFPFGRDVFNVVATADVTGTSAKAALIQDTFVDGTSSVCQAGSIIATYGFGIIANCGNTSLKSGFVS